MKLIKMLILYYSLISFMLIYKLIMSNTIDSYSSSGQVYHSQRESTQILETKLQDLRSKQNPLVEFVDKHFNLKNNPNQKNQLPEAVKWQIVHAGPKKRN